MVFCLALLVKSLRHRFDDIRSVTINNSRALTVASRRANTCNTVASASARIRVSIFIGSIDSNGSFYHLASVALPA